MALSAGPDILPQRLQDTDELRSPIRDRESLARFLEAAGGAMQGAGGSARGVKEQPTRDRKG